LRSAARGASSTSVGSRHRRAATVAVTALAIAGVACNAVLGLDPPQLDSCANGCADGAAPVKGDGAPDAVDGAVFTDGPPALADAADAAPDQGPLTGIRCGGGSSAVGCQPASPVCCAELEAGSASYVCDTTTAACSGYPILCATNNDCSGTDVCCHYDSAIKCVGETVCANASLVCDPSGPSDQCPSGWSCNVAFTNGSTTLPYYGCSQ
jgi:hypothetical protein